MNEIQSNLCYNMKYRFRRNGRHLGRHTQNGVQLMKSEMQSIDIKYAKPQIHANIMPILLSARKRNRYTSH